jgi:hypothetical protein
MPNHKTDTQDDIPTDLIPLGEFAWPQGETQQTLQHIFEKLTVKIPWLGTEHSVNHENLHSIRDQDLIAAAHERLKVILFTCLDTRLLDWATDPNSGVGRQAFVYPPMRPTLLRDWANARNLAVITSFENLEADKTADAVVFILADQPLLRDSEGIANVRSLVQSLAEMQRKVIIGCNSWTWRYLTAVTSIDTSLPTQVTTPAFVDRSLAALLEPVISEAYDLSDVRSESSGDPVFERDNKGALKDPYFAKLAKRSLGLPWNAIEMFFDDAQASANDADGDEKDIERNRTVMWLRQSGSSSLPKHEHALICMALQNLLIHEPCRAETIAALLPRPLPQGIWTTLATLGFVTIEEDGLRHNPRHYSTIRSALATAGLNLDQL